MAVEQTQVLPSPVLEGSLTSFLKKLEKKNIQYYLESMPKAEGLGLMKDLHMKDILNTKIKFIRHMIWLKNQLKLRI